MNPPALPCVASYTGGSAAMIQAALLSQLGVGQLDPNHYDVASFRDETAGPGWLMIVRAEPGGPVYGYLARLDPGTMGRGLLHFCTAAHDGLHHLETFRLGDPLTSAAPPPLPALCAFVRLVRAAIAAERVPDVEALALLHLGLALPLPPVEVRPDDFACRLEFGAADEDD